MAGLLVKPTLISYERKNMNITLIVVPGTGARIVDIPVTTTVEALISQENLHGRDIIINGTSVLPSAYQTTNIPRDSEVFATGSVKGNNFFSN